jgi:hypothetical protein
MKRILSLALWLMAGTLWAQASDSSTPATTQGSPYATPTPTIVKKWNFSAIPWGDWFKDNANVTDNTDYVYFFWNAQDFKANLEVKDKKRRLAEAALQLASRLFPAGAKADTVKVDIVYILERDAYNQPKLNTLQKVAHFEFHRAKALKLATGKKEPSLKDLQKAFDKFVIY